MNAFWEVFEPANVVRDLRAVEREGVLAELVGTLVSGGTLARREGEKALELLRKREALGSTGIGGGVAIPHVKMPGLRRIAAALGLSRTGIDYRSVDGVRVRVVFLVLRPDGEEEEHLRFLRWISNLARNRVIARFALAAKDVPEVVGLLREFSESP